MLDKNGSNIYNFDFVSDGLIIDRLIGSDGAKKYSIEDFPPEFQEKMLESARQLVVMIRKTWYKVDNQADVVNDCLLHLLHWASVAFMAGMQVGIIAKTDEPERFVKKPKEIIKEEDAV